MIVRERFFCVRLRLDTGTGVVGVIHVFAVQERLDAVQLTLIAAIPIVALGNNVSVTIGRSR